MKSARKQLDCEFAQYSDDVMTALRRMCVSGVDGNPGDVEREDVRRYFDFVFSVDQAALGLREKIRPNGK